jgi:hypothetical protein
MRRRELIAVAGLAVVVTVGVVVEATKIGSRRETSLASADS